jgi:hypothetical protein
MVKGYTIKSLKNWVKTVQLKGRGGRGRGNDVSVAFLSSTLRMQENKLAWVLRV